MEIRYIAILFLYLLILSCKGKQEKSLNQKSSDRVSNENNREIVENNKWKFSDELTMKHDLAISVWFTLQEAARSLIAHNIEGGDLQRKEIYFSKFDDNPHNVLLHQERGIREFQEKFQGVNRDTIANQWLTYQKEARDTLSDFLATARVYSDHSPPEKKPKGVDTFQSLIEEQRVYQFEFEDYRRSWKPDHETPNQ